MFNINSIKTKRVVVLAIIMGLLLLCQILFITPLVKKDVLTDVGNSQAQIAQQLSEMLDMSFDEAAHELEDISRDPYIVSMDKNRIEKAFQNVKLMSLFFDGFSVYNAKKESIYSSDNYSPGEKGNLHQGIEESMLSAGTKIYFSGAFSPIVDDPAFRFITPVFSPGGKPEGCIVGIYSAARLKNILSRVVNTKIGMRGHAYIISAEGNVVVFPEKSDAAIKPGSIDNDFVTLPQKIARQDEIIEYAYNNASWVAAFRPLKKTKLYVVVHQPKEDIVKEANREKAFIINGFIVAFILCAFILTFIIQVAFKPLTSLIENIKSGKFQSGNKYPKHEIGQLAKEFNTVYSNLLKSEKELRESEARFREHTNLLPESIFEMDIDGRLTFVNESAFENFGYTEDDLKKELNAFDMIIPEERERAISNSIIRLKGEKPERSEFTALRKDKSTFPSLIRVAPIMQDNRHVGFRGVVINISDRIKAEKVLMDSEDRYRSIVENSNQGIVVVDESYRLEYVNDKICQLLGYSRNEMIGQNFRMHIDQSCSELVQKNCLLRQSGDSAPNSYEACIIRKDGAKLFVEISSSIVLSLTGEKRTVAQLLDITDRKKAEIALRESEAKYRSILENIEEVFYEVDLKGNITYVNDAAEKLLGYPAEELMGLNNRTYTTPETAKRMYGVFNRVYLTGEPAKINDYEIITKEGGIKLLEISTFLVMDQDGNKTGFRGLIRDVSERIRAEKEKKKLEAQFYQAQKMEAIGTLAGGIAHDLNNILMGIQGNASMVLMDIDISDPHYEKLKNIEEYVISGSNLTKQLLGFARSGKYHVRATNLNELVEKTSRMFGRTKKEIRINTRFQDGILLVNVDQSQIEQVLLNIYVNAWQAMPAGGDLYLDVKNIIIDEGYVRSYKINPGRYVRVSITDTGIGMDDATRQRIFDPFFTTKEMGRGTGLGLASAYGIVKNHGGFINVYSEIGRGTTFNIYLPVSEKKEINEEIQPVENIIKGSGMILFVDDEEMIISLGKEILKKLGYNVLLANGGREAIEVYEKNRETIDLVILDMIMPDLSGNDVFEKMKEINPDVRVLLSSGYSIKGQAAEIIKKGCSGFIQKPFNAIQLSIIIDKIMKDGSAFYSQNTSDTII
ncbi:MAG: PAS domain S-box protein [Desulfobacteraceae bacterium]|nr:MAG: PAS domain S-box protein [Desulfobacteraceae bacterium]